MLWSLVMVMAFRWLLAGILNLNVCLCVEIKRLSVPRWVENGTETSVTLDCEYVYNQNDIRLVVKWFFDENLEPVYQWIPELGRRYTSGILSGRLDLNYSVNTMDAYSRYRALKISQPSTELSGKYTCLVTSLAGQDSKAQLMTVFVPARTMDVKFDTSSNLLNVSCEATGLFPRPKLKLYRLLPSQRSPAIVKDVLTSMSNTKDAYNTTLYRSFEQEELSLPGTTGFECVVEIPGTNYQRRKRVAYYAGAQDREKYVCCVRFWHFQYMSCPPPTHCITNFSCGLRGDCMFRYPIEHH